MQELEIEEQGEVNIVGQDDDDDVVHNQLEVAEAMQISDDETQLEDGLDIDSDHELSDSNANEDDENINQAEQEDDDSPIEAHEDNDNDMIENIEDTEPAPRRSSRANRGTGVERL